MATDTISYRREQIGGATYWLPSRYQNLVSVGSGSFGHVCKAFDQETRKEVAIKRIGYDRSSQAGIDWWKMLLREIRLMVHFDKHENLLHLKDIVMPHSPDYDSICLVSQFMRTDLNTLLVKHPKHFTAENLFSTLYAILNGLFAVHSANVMHRDLKPSNILVDADGTTLLADFGLGRNEPDAPRGQLTSYVVTRWYRAPEVLLGVSYTKKIDIWSLGCVFAEMLAVHCNRSQNRVLFPGRNSGVTPMGLKEQIRMILDFVGHRPGANDDWVSETPRKFLRSERAREPADLQARFPGVDAQALDLLRKMLTWDPRARPSARECFFHPYWGDYAWAEGEEDDPWPVFSGDFERYITSEEKARELVNLEVTRFHSQYRSMAGVKVSEEASLLTADENAACGDDEEMFAETGISEQFA